jgi:hypothetical protein
LAAALMPSPKVVPPPTSPRSSNPLLDVEAYHRRCWSRGIDEDLCESTRLRELCDDLRGSERNNPAVCGIKPTPYLPLWLPPPEYDYPFPGKVTEIRGDASFIHRACGNSSIGCARLSLAQQGECTIYLANDDVITRLGFTLDVVRRHEIGHCNGWVHDPRRFGD